MSSFNETTTTAKTPNLVPYQIILRTLVISFGLTILLTGIVGNLLNIVIFTWLGYYKQNTCSVYIICRSLFDLLTLFFGLGSRILSQGFSIDFTLTNSFWCRVRVPIIYINTLSSYTVLCLQSIDAFLVTSPSISLRQKSHPRVALYLVLTFFVFWTLEEAPHLFFQQLVVNSSSGKGTCVTVNIIYANYRTYFIYLWLTTMVPLVVIILFDLLTYRQVQQNSRQKRTRLFSVLTRQMTRMTLFHIIVVLLFQAPFGIAQCYFITRGLSDDPIRKAQEQIVQQFFNVHGYGIYAVSGIER